MSEQSIPAWKRAGLKASKQTPKSDKSSYDPLKEGLKRAHESGETSKSAKPPKKAKLPKAERPAPTHELDQLAYLRQYFEDKENWKFSKQKQNWILKHMFTDINDEKYDKPLIAYIEGLQGSARTWAIDDSKELIQKWNEFMKEEDKEEKEEGEAEEKEPTEEKESDETKGNVPKAKSKPKKKEEPSKKIPTEKMVKRAQKIVELLTGEKISVELLDSISS